MPDQDAIGIVIATRDRRDGLLATLGNIRAAAPGAPVAVVDNGSRDGTPEAVRASFPEVEVVELGRNLGAAARNLGAQRLGTRYVAFSDDDSWWARGAVQRAVEVLDAHPRVALLAARVLVGPGERLDPVCTEMARSPLPTTGDRPGPAVLGFVACGAIVRRDAFLAVGGFEARYGIGGEEARLALALASEGWELRYVAEVVAHHHPARSDGRAGRNARVLRNDLWTIWSTRPLRDVLAATVRLVRAAGPSRSTAEGLLGAVRGAAWVARERRPAPPELAAAVRTLERQAPIAPRGPSARAGRSSAGRWSRRRRAG